MKITQSKLREMIKNVIREVAPEGWEGTVKAMKKEKDIDNPWALAHWMKNKGYKSHKRESMNEGVEYFKSKKKNEDLYYKKVGNKWYKSMASKKGKVKWYTVKFPQDLDMKDMNKLNKSNIPSELGESNLNELELKGKKYVKHYADVYNNPSRYSKADVSKLNDNDPYDLAKKYGILNSKRDKKNGTYKFISKIPSKLKLKESVNEARLKRGSKITYMRHFAFGKKGKETARVMAIRGNDVLLDNGQELDKRHIKFKPKDYKVESVNEAKRVNIDDLLKNPKVKQIMKRLGIRGNDIKSVAKIVQHFMRNPAALKAIGA